MSEIEKLMMYRKGLNLAICTFGKCQDKHHVSNSFFAEFYDTLQEEKRIIDMQIVNKLEEQYE
jgi:hypothetical protein